jgi:hypothetical protein
MPRTIVSRGCVRRAARSLALLATLAFAPPATAAVDVAAASPLSLDREVRQAPVLDSLAELRKKGASTTQQIDAIERRLNVLDERFAGINEKMLALEVVAKGNAEDMDRLQAVLSGRLERIENYLRLGFGLVALISLGIIVTLVTLTREIARRVGPAIGPARVSQASRARIAVSRTGPVPGREDRLPADAG